MVRARIRDVIEGFREQETTVELSVVSQLANGADRIVVREVRALASERDGGTARLEAYLPFAHDEYVEAQEFDRGSREEFDRLLRTATVLREPVGSSADTAESRNAAYRAAGHRLVGRCDLLVALWDGKASGGRGGTAEILQYAAARTKPCIWISTAGEPQVDHNLAEGDGRRFFEEVARRAELEQPIEWSKMEHPNEALDPLLQSYRSLDDFNRDPLPGDYESILREELVSRTGVAPWVAAPFTRATILAARWRRRFHWTARLVTLLAAAAAVMLAVGLSYGKGTEGWTWAEAAILALALLGLVMVRRRGFHRRWLSYRVLAEHLRSAHFLAPTGTDFRRQARLEPVYSGSEPTAWLMRGFEEVWDRRPPQPQPLSELSDPEQEQLKHGLADDWIGGQIRYHQGAVRHHRLWHRILAGSVAFFFLATIAFACLHSLRMAEDTAVFFSITLPAAAASLGVLLTVNQHHALSERSARMSSDLAIVRSNVLDTPPEGLDRVSAEAARVIAQENGAWFGSMWFLDIEHP